MKNAYVTEHHHGADGNAYEGRILLNMTETRFEDLKGKGLVREATADEVKAGSQPPFESEAQAAEKAAAEPNNKQALEPANKAASKPANKAAN